VVLVLLTAVRLVGRVEELRSFKHGTAQFLDFRIFFEAVARAEETGQLYASDRPDFFLPGSAVYKFPPPFAATLTPFTEYDWLPVAKLFVVVNLFLLACVLTVFWRSVRPQGWRWVLVSLVFLNWQPFWETLLGVQLEIGILLLLTLGLASVRTGRFLTSGAAVGVAAAFKVYPVFLLSYFVLWRRWRGLVGAVIGGGGALLVATVVISLGESIRYFVEILPRLGGTSLSPENLSLVAQISRVFVGPSGIRDLFGDANTNQILESTPQGIWVFGFLVTGLSTVLIGSSVAAVHRARKADCQQREALSWCMAICLLVILIPSSWVDYQTLLVLPAMYAVASASRPRVDPLAWTLLGLAVLPAIVIDLNDAIWNPGLGLFAALRALVPLFLWGALVRILVKPREAVTGSISLR